MLGSLINRYRLWRLKREAIRILHGFDDHRLSDVGTFRDNIELFVAEHATIPSRPAGPRYRNAVAQRNLNTSKRVTP